MLLIKGFFYLYDRVTFILTRFILWIIYYCRCYMKNQDLKMESQLMQGVDIQLEYTSFIEMGKKALIQQEFNKAKELLTIAIARKILEPAAYNLMGVLFQYEGEEMLAKKMYRAALAVEPSYTPAIENLDHICQSKYMTKGINLG